MDRVGETSGFASWPIAVLALLFASFALLEAFLPLRRRVESRRHRYPRNVATGALAWLAAAPLQIALLHPLAAAVERRGLGLVPWLGLPAAAGFVLAFLGLDYGLWLWHRLNHRVGWLWRFHLVHHVDLDLDASTGLRFHFGELVLSVFYRAIQVLVIGPPAAALATWQAVLPAAVLFHHANLRLPEGFDRRLADLLVTPRMHGIHHSQVRAERNSNFASLLTIWDRLHRTLRLDVPQEAVAIGVPGHLAPGSVTFAAIQALPFRAGSGAADERP